MKLTILLFLLFTSCVTFSQNTEKGSSISWRVYIRNISKQPTIPNETGVYFQVNAGFNGPHSIIYEHEILMEKGDTILVDCFYEDEVYGIIGSRPLIDSSGDTLVPFQYSYWQGNLNVDYYILDTGKYFIHNMTSEFGHLNPVVLDVKLQEPNQTLSVDESAPEEEKLPFLVQSAFSNEVYLNTNTDEPTDIKVFNSMGQVISEFNVTRSHILHLDNLAIGLYYVIGIIDGERKTGKIFKN